MKKQRVLVAAVVVVLSIGAVVLATGHGPRATHRVQQRAVYYCPMHPTYTGDKPGDCPICNMQLVKKETAAAKPQEPRTAKDVCIMHHCPMMHVGQPCPMLVVAKAGEAVTCPVCKHHVAAAAAPAAQRILYWTDPMLPGYKSDKPGKSPMGMEMVPVYAEAGAAPSAAAPAGYATVLVTPQKRQFIGVKTARAERRRLTKTIRAAGTIAHDPELYQAQAEYIQAIQAAAQARQGAVPEAAAQAEQLVDSTRIRLKHLGLSDAMIAEIAAWPAAEHGLLFAHPGDPVWMYAQVYEYELPLVRVGQTVTVDAATLPGETFGGTVRAVDALVDPATRTTRIRAQLEDPDGHLRPDMYVNAAIAVDLGEVVAVPDEAVFNTGTKQIVFVDKGEGLFEPRDVTVGVTADGFYEIKSGVAESEAIVTSGNFLIDSESRLKAALEGISGDGGHHHGGQ